jgi:hypothetical protein
MENTVSLCSFVISLGVDGRKLSRLVLIPSSHDLACPFKGWYADNGGDEELYRFNGGVDGQDDACWGGAKKDNSDALTLTRSAAHSTIWKDESVGDCVPLDNCDLVNNDESLEEPNDDSEPVSW